MCNFLAIVQAGVRGYVRSATEAGIPPGFQTNHGSTIQISLRVKKSQMEFKNEGRGGEGWVDVSDVYIRHTFLAWRSTIKLEIRNPFDPILQVAQAPQQLSRPVKAVTLHSGLTGMWATDVSKRPHPSLRN
jgi:hypothetical protein